jgi:inositol oxygenase
MHLWAQANAHSLPREALAILRLHSCYPLHERGEYAQLLAPGDELLIEAVRRFQKYDLYSKADARPDM